ncbi:MAG: hypothetical protein V5789_02755 [Colwellia sp.]
MATEWIDVVDTAVKIGLGALISGVATYKVSSLNHSKGIEKVIIDKKISMLEEISEDAETYFYFASSLSNTIGGMQKIATNFGGSLTEQQKKRISKRHEGFLDILAARNKAASKIKMLGIGDAEDAINEFNETLSELRNLVVFEKVMITIEEKEAFSDRFKLSKDDFYKAIGRRMGSIET